MSIGIVTALHWEYALLQKCISAENPAIASGIAVALAGMGPGNAARSASELLDQGVTGLASFGCCAGLAPQLRAGDLILPRSISDGKNLELACDANWHAQLAHILEPLSGNASGQRLYTGEMLTSTDAVLTKTAAKGVLHAATQAAAADMESLAIATVAQQAGVPFVAIRVVLDDRRQPLPRALPAVCDSFGRLPLSRLAGLLISQPEITRHLIPLARSRRLAGRRMRNAMALLARHWQDLIEKDTGHGNNAACSTVHILRDEHPYPTS